MKYYHGSRKRLKIKSILTATKKSTDFSFELSTIDEAIVELLRPEKYLSRLECLFMADDVDSILELGGSTKYIYEVEPIGQVDSSNLFWLSTAFSVNDTSTRDECIINYWEGTSVTHDDLLFFTDIDPDDIDPDDTDPEEEDSIESVTERWEYRTKSFKIIKKLRL